MITTKAAREASDVAWKLVDRMIETGKYPADVIAKRIGYRKGLVQMEAARKKGSVMPQTKREAVHRLFEPEVAGGTWPEFAAAASMAREQLVGIVGQTPREILHPAIQRWLDDLEAMSELQMNGAR